MIVAVSDPTLTMKHDEEFLDWSHVDLVIEFGVVPVSWCYGGLSLLALVAFVIAAFLVCLAVMFFPAWVPLL